MHRCIDRAASVSRRTVAVIESGAQDPAHALCRIERRRRLRDEEVEAWDGFDEVSAFVVDVDRATLAAIVLLVHEKEFVDRIDGDARAAEGLTGIPRAR